MEVKSNKLRAKFAKSLGVAFDENDVFEFGDGSIGALKTSEYLFNNNEIHSDSLLIESFANRKSEGVQPYRGDLPVVLFNRDDNRPLFAYAHEVKWQFTFSWKPDLKELINMQNEADKPKTTITISTRTDEEMAKDLEENTDFRMTSGNSDYSFYNFKKSKSQTEIAAEGLKRLGKIGASADEMVNGLRSKASQQVITNTQEIENAMYGEDMPVETPLEILKRKQRDDIEQCLRKAGHFPPEGLGKVLQDDGLLPELSIDADLFAL